MLLKGEKVVLRKAVQTDAEKMYYWKFEEEKQEAKKWNGPYIPEPFQSKEKFLADWNPKEEILPGTPSFLVIEVEGNFIGTVSCYWVDRNTNWLETGIVIYDSSYWSGGYGSESYRMWIDFLFQSTNLHRLGFSTWSGNIRMMKAAAKLGMQEEARIRKARMVNGEYYDAIKMGILREEWERQVKK
ncbi:RimJ/RimL family protein N-acetyltransferase [Salirhabdus euzebyi]|uniref:RimJ/RimL family protein N-acetyltransferase n=1 Tax=Salirhabdus euzebyi TaxID=394506 RepID=A0A841PWW1_9BACI|nr:GNAT family protein [Salirhabdus euzebyi]MBB6452424.1 RimJ/RimL family protein N-acetyltransferase [Salirhabdus euzebyi]